MNAADIITRHAAAAPAAPAVIEAGTVLDYARFEGAIWRAAAALRHAGIAPGSVIGVTMRGTALHLAAGYALARLGAIQISLPYREAGAVRAGLAARFGAAAILGDGDDARLPGLPLHRADPQWLEPAPARPDPGLRSPGGGAGWKIALTSGTTDAPKAVLKTHAMHIAWRELNQAAVPLAPADRYLAVVEPDFFAGFRLCMDVHWAGGAVVVGESPRSVDDLFGAIGRHSINYLYLTPSHLHQLVPALPRGAHRLPRLRGLRTGSMVVPEALRREILERLTPNLLVVYGTNDGGTPLTLADRRTLERFPGSIGLPVPGVEVGIADEEGRPLPAGETGLIRARAPGLPRAYLDNAEASAKAFRDGWYYPGDLGVLSAEGALYFKGRADDRMNYDGIKIYPAEIEAVLLEHPGVAEAAAFPLDSEAHQHLPAAAVVLRDGASQEAVHAFCRERLGVRAPAFIAALGALPRNAAGKVLKRELSALLGGHLARKR